MEIQLRNTSKIVHLNGVPARVWEGHPASGTAVNGCAVSGCGSISFTVAYLTH